MPPSPLLLLPPRFWLVQLMSASLLELPSSALLILLLDCLKLGSVFLIVAELVAVVATYVAEVPGDAAYRYISCRVGVVADKVVGVDFRHHPSNVCKGPILSLKMGLANFVVLWWKALQDDVLVLAVRGALFGGDGI